MKNTTIFMLFVWLLLSFVAVSCNDDEDNSLRFADDVVAMGNVVDVYFPNSADTVIAITVLGGDRNYTVSCDNPSVLEVDKKFPNAFVLIPKNWGSANVTVTDGTKASIKLQVNVTQSVVEYLVAKCDVLIEGEGKASLTKKEIEELMEKALQTIPVSEGGGYKMIANDPNYYNKGELIIYPHKYGNETGVIKTEFSFPTIISSESFAFHFLIDGEIRTFTPKAYRIPDTRTSPEYPGSLVEDVTNLIMEQDKNVRVYTQQLYSRVRNE